MPRTLVILNAKAGTILDLGADQVRADVDAALTLPDNEVDVMVREGPEMVEVIRSAPSLGYDRLIVGAGDGTVSTAVSVLAGSDIALGILPLGTMNMLAYDIGLPRDLPGALAALRDAVPMRIDVATVNGRAFHGVSGIGFFSQMALAREAYRQTHGRIVGWFLALGRALIRSGRVRLDIEVDGRRVSMEAYAALVTNNSFDGAGWHRLRMDAGEIEVHIAEERGALARIRLGADVLVQSWRDNPGVHSFKARRVVINSARRSRAWVATDGEVMREDLPLVYEIKPKALTLLVPPNALQRPDTEAAA
ncbi:MAG: diacylglycerol kinase [Rhizobiales bacterium 32-66-11]|nr:MAG: diacylglycerol kinase [Rhizobiales bacterium 32-66-11]